jgi:sulfatase maturation enzyme AslB (radical SAM superfamily)
MDAAALKQALKDPFFAKVHSVGVNGGEPSLYGSIDGLLEALFVLKKLRRIFVISNGLVTAKLLEMLKKMKAACMERRIILHLTISVDGIDEVHNTIRGIPNAFAKTMQTLRTIQADRDCYCDVLEAGCTLSRQNMPYAVELESAFDALGIAAWFHPAVPNRRLHNFDDAPFSLLNDEPSRMLATEYFFSRFKYGEGFKNRLRAFLTYDYFLHKGKRRLAGCIYLRSDVTITESLDLCLCAAASTAIGNLKTDSASALLKQGKFKQAENEVQRHCQECVHYIIFPTLRGMYHFVKELLKPSIWIGYKVWSAWSR